MRLLKSGDLRNKKNFSRKMFSSKKINGEKRIVERKVSSTLFRFHYETNIPAGALMLLLECFISINKLLTCQQ